ncbi:Uncharacterised protein [Streptococcus pneumoniae]|nr:Uncharacterised protein [Streptococcus pneumoniae]
MKKLYRIHFIAIAVIDLLLFAFFIPNHSYLSQLDVTNIGKYIFYILNAIGALFVWNDEEVRYIEGNSNKEY